MSKASRNKQQAVRERIAAQRAAARRAEVRNRILLAGSSVLLVLVIVVVIVVVKLNNSSAPVSPAGGRPLPASVTRQITGVPAGTLDSVGAGSALAVLKGLTWAQIASALHDPKNPVAQGAVGAANMITAAICKMTGNQPAGVCTSATTTALQPGL